MTDPKKECKYCGAKEGKDICNWCQNKIDTYEPDEKIEE